MRKILPGLICLALLAFVFTGCSSGGGDTGQSYWQGGTGGSTNPQVTGVTPVNLAPGGQFTITGTNFGSERSLKDDGLSYVNFEPSGGGTATQVTEYASWSDTQVVGTVPALSTSSKAATYIIVVYRVTTGGTASSSTTATAENTVTVGGPVVTALVPTETGIGRPVTITGTGFGAAQGASTVTINSVPVTQFVSWSDTEILAVVPLGATTGPVQVTVDTAPSNSDQTLAVLAQARYLAVCLRDNAEIAIVDLTVNPPTVTTRALPNGSEGDTPDPKSIDITPDGKYFYISDEENSDVIVMQVSDGTIVATIDTSPSTSTSYNAWGMKVHPNGKWAYVVAHDDYYLSVIDTATNTVASILPMPDYPNSLALSLDGKYGIVGSEDNEFLPLLDIQANSVIDSFIPSSSSDEGWYVAFTPDGQYAFSSTWENYVDVFQVSDRTLVDTPAVLGSDGGDESAGLAVTPDGQQLLVALFDSTDIAIISLAALPFTQTGTITTSATATNDPKRIVVDFDGSRAFQSSQDDDLISIIDLTTNTETGTINFGAGDDPNGMVLY